MKSYICRAVALALLAVTAQCQSKLMQHARNLRLAGPAAEESYNLVSPSQTLTFFV